MIHFVLVLLWCFFILPASMGGAAEPKIQIVSPQDGSRILQAQPSVLVKGKVSTQNKRRANVDLFLVLDTSGSTAHYAGLAIGDPDVQVGGSSHRSRPQIGIFGGGIGLGMPSQSDFRNSILVAEISAGRRLVAQLSSETTRVGVVTFGEGAIVVQPLTNDFERVKQSLDQVLSSGPHGGTNMAEGIRQSIRELSGLGSSKRRDDAIKTAVLLTDGFPTLPIGASKRAAPEDTELAINAARIAAKAGIKIHVFALGEEALSYPRAAVGIAQESGGIFTPVVRPGDILGVLDTLSLVGVELVQVVNETTNQKASQLRLAADGFFSAAVPVKEGLNRIRVLARASDGSSGRESLSIYYESGGERSLDVEVFLEKEQSRRADFEKLGRSQEELQAEIDRVRQNALKQTGRPPPPLEER